MTQKFNYVEHYKIDAEEFDYFEERTGATAHDERRVHEFIISKIKKNVNNILDVGAGSAWVAQHFKDSEIRVVSLDISLLNVKKAKSIVTVKNHTQIVADSFKLPFDNNTFDCVIASEIIEHVIDPKLFIEELFRVVKPSGSLIITTPYKEKLRYYLCVHCNKKTPIHAHIHSFDENKLLKMSPKDVNYSSYSIFGNKLLIFLRTYVILKYLPFKGWKFTDSIFNRIKNIPVHILVEFCK
ncbi:MAG: methyltransferase domain-containing protein [Melioribacteraceae bacterium]|nr:methyltransferase domain-containing protein [Melioribacteraceae bacterium]